MKTFMANAQNVERKWYVVDAAGKTVGRLAAEVAKILRGKHKPTFTPHVDTGDHVIIVNAEKVEFTGKKLAQKTYFRHSGYPGGTTFTTAGKMLADKPERVLEMAIKGMLPKNRLGRQMYRKLNVYRGSEHPHAAQKPEVLNFDIR
jgi:large subunit ribosomal protein L13